MRRVSRVMYRETAAPEERNALTALSPNGATAKQRNRETAPDSERRQIPNGAEFHTARNPEGRKP
jgi:hypothetical protein